MARLILWDIDGTLVRAGDIGAEIFDVAIENRLGRPPAARIAMSGKTDPQIVLEYLTEFDLPDDHDHLPAILEGIEAELAARAGVISAHGYVLPGIAELLARLAADDDFDQTVLTGNIAPNALLKVGAFGLDRWLNLAMGAYGSDHVDRNELVPIAPPQGRRRLRGLTFTGPDEVWVVGDAPNDLACARAGGVRCLLVATGRPTYDELAALHPDALRHDLSDVDEIVALLWRRRRPTAAAGGTGRGRFRRRARHRVGPHRPWKTSHRPSKWPPPSVAGPWRAPSRSSTPAWPRWTN